MNKYQTKMTFATSTKAARMKVARKTFADKPDQTTTTLVGYPIVWNNLSGDRGGYKVRLVKGSAQFSPTVMALWHHDYSRPLASTDNGTLRIMPADDYGIPVEIDLDCNTTIGRDVQAYTAATPDKKPLVSGMSFSMANGFEDYTEGEENGVKVVTVRRFTTDDITVTPIPSFVEATVEQMATSPQQIAEITAPAPLSAPQTIAEITAPAPQSKQCPERIAASRELAKKKLDFLKKELSPIRANR